MKKVQHLKPPTSQSINTEMESCDKYADIFLEMFKLLAIYSFLFS